MEVISNVGPAVDVSSDKFLIFIFHHFLNISGPFPTFDHSISYQLYFHRRKGSQEMAKMARIESNYGKLS